MEQLRLQYLMNDIDEDELKKKIFIKERIREKTTEEVQILDTYLTGVSERFNAMIEACAGKDYNERRVMNFIDAVSNIRDFCNEAFAVNWKAMKYKKIQKITFGSVYR